MEASRPPFSSLALPPDRAMNFPTLPLSDLDAVAGEVLRARQTLDEPKVIMQRITEGNLPESLRTAKRRRSLAFDATGKTLGRLQRLVGPAVGSKDAAHRGGEGGIQSPGHYHDVAFRARKGQQQQP
jgi:hypothetical protein